MSRLQQLFRFLDDSPDESFLLFAIAKEYESAGDLDNALQYYLKLTETNPNYVGTYYHLAKLYERKAKFNDALQTYQTGMAVAQRLQDRHAYSELSGAKLNLELGTDED
jgi:tetratricopeptide (TPR) repeat protein